MQKHVTLLLPTLLLAVMSSAFGDSFDDYGQAEQGMRTESVFQAGIITSYRLDDLNKYDYVPSLGGQLYYFFHPMVALRAGFSHNSLTRLSRDVSYHSIVADIGMRVNTSHTRVVPFLETGFSFPYVWGVNRGYEYADLQPGALVGAGLSLRVSKSLAFDLSILHIINRLNTQIDFLPMPGEFGYAPCPPGEDCPPLRSQPTGAFNPTLLELVVRFGL